MVVPFNPFGHSGVCSLIGMSFSGHLRLSVTRSTFPVAFKRHFWPRTQFLPELCIRRELSGELNQLLATGPLRSFLQRYVGSDIFSMYRVMHPHRHQRIHRPRHAPVKTSSISCGQMFEPS